MSFLYKIAPIEDDRWEVYEDDGSCSLWVADCASNEVAKILADALRVEQLEDDDTLPLARRTDPETSHLAGEKVRRSDKYLPTKKALYQVCLRHPGLVGPEIAQLAGLTWRTTWPRLSDLKNKQSTKPPVLYSGPKRHAVGVPGMTENLYQSFYPIADVQPWWEKEAA